ncbi:MAG: hypothetical protein ACE5DS_06370 [Kiloniellaceae bacterium]
MLEKLSGYFYDPVVFWTVPLVLVAVGSGWRFLRSRPWSRRFGAPQARNDSAENHAEQSPRRRGKH